MDLRYMDEKVHGIVGVPNSQQPPKSGSQLPLWKIKFTFKEASSTICKIGKILDSEWPAIAKKLAI